MRNNDSYSKYLAESYLQKLSLNQSKHAATWHRLNLARAKLKASSRTSALLSGFAMVINYILPNKIQYIVILTFYYIC